MTNRELRRLSRAALLELLIAQMEDNQKLREQLESQQVRLDQMEMNAYEASLSDPIRASRYLSAEAIKNIMDMKQSAPTEPVKKAEPLEVVPPKPEEKAEIVETATPEPKEEIEIVENATSEPDEAVAPVEIGTPEPEEKAEIVESATPESVEKAEPVEAAPPEPVKTEAPSEAEQSGVQNPLAEAMAWFAINNQPKIVEQVSDTDDQAGPAETKERVSKIKRKAASTDFFDEAFAAITKNN